MTKKDQEALERIAIRAGADAWIAKGAYTLAAGKAWMAEKEASLARDEKELD